MINFTIKNMPETVHRQLKKQAEVNRRSLNSEIIAHLEKTINPQPVDVEKVLKEARELRKKAKGHLTQKDLEMAKKWGRP